jgi:hypothetical protein
MNNIGAIEVKNALLNRSTQKSYELADRASARMTNKASDVRKGLHTVDTIFATSVHTRLRTRSGDGGTTGGLAEGEPGGACTGTGLRPSSPNTP